MTKMSGEKIGILKIDNGEEHVYRIQDVSEERYPLWDQCSPHPWAEWRCWKDESNPGGEDKVDAGLLKHYWAEAVAGASYLRTRLPTHSAQCEKTLLWTVAWEEGRLE